MKKVVYFAMVALMIVASTAWAQDLDTTAIADQFNTGARGNESGTGGTYGEALTDGSEYADYSGIDSSGGTIRYINTYAGASSGDATNGETPVLAVTNVGNPDRALLGNTIPANTRPGASDGNTVVLISDDGGTNCLFFGETDDADYFVEADVYCYDQSAVAGESWAMVAIRAGRDGTLTTSAYTIDRDASYALVYDYSDLTAYAVIFTDAYAGLYTAGVPTPEGSQVLTEGWHTFRVEAHLSYIQFSVDGTIIAAIDDESVTNGRGSIGFREGGVASADERAGTFDNLKAGPTTITSVEQWMLMPE